MYSAFECKAQWPYTIKEIKRVKNVDLDLDKVARDDPTVYKMIRTTNTLGLFQIESPGQRELTGKHQPTKFNDLTMQISLFRPGPMKGNMIKPYLDGRHGFIQPDYMHPDLHDILKESYGVVVFHEQLMRIMQVMTGCSLARADEMRRQLGKPDKARVVQRYFKKSARRQRLHSSRSGSSVVNPRRFRKLWLLQGTRRCICSPHVSFRVAKNSLPPLSS